MASPTALHALPHEPAGSREPAAPAAVGAETAASAAVADSAEAAVEDPQQSAAAATRELAPPITPAEPALDAEKLVVYRVALELQLACAQLVPAQQRVLHDQLERASLSVVLCIAEGAGRRSRKDKRRFYAMARGSCMEAAAACDVLRLRRLAPESACRNARGLALRVVQLLTKLDAALAK